MLCWQYTVQQHNLYAPILQYRQIYEIQTYVAQQHIQMQRPVAVHGCLFFQCNGSSYLYGLTRNLLVSGALAKLSPTYVILVGAMYPTGLYAHEGLQEILQSLATGSQQGVKESLVKSGSHGQGAMVKLLQHTTLLISPDCPLVLLHPCLTPLPPPPLPEPLLLSTLHQLHTAQVSSQCPLPWVSCPAHELKLIIPQFGTSTYLYLPGKLIVIDPSEEWICYMRCNRVSAGELLGAEVLGLLSMVVLTHAGGVGPVVGVLLQAGVGRVRVLVTHPGIEAEIIAQAWRYLGYPESITRSRLLITCMAPLQCYGLCSSSTSTLSCSWNDTYVQPYLQLLWGSSPCMSSHRQVLVFPGQPVAHFPQPLLHQNVEYALFTQLSEAMNRELKALPMQTRKKIIYNRAQHKYNHKYFVTLEAGRIETCTITDRDYRGQGRGAPGRLVEVQPWGGSCMGGGVVEGELGARYYELGEGAQAEGQCLELLEGWGKAAGRVWGVGRVPAGRVTALTRCRVKVNFQVNLRADSSLSASEHQQNRVKLQHMSHNKFLYSLGPAILTGLAPLCQPRLLNPNQHIEQPHRYLHLIISGAIQWSSSTETAQPGDLVLNLAQFYYPSQPTSKQYVIVRQQTEMLVINAHDLHSVVLTRHPHLLHPLLAAGGLLH